MKTQLKVRDHTTTSRIASHKQFGKQCKWNSLVFPYTHLCLSIKPTIPIDNPTVNKLIQKLTIDYEPSEVLQQNCLHKLLH
jgi:hypothetical protein